MKRKFSLLLLACTAALISLAQTRTVTGKVISDSTRLGLAGVTVNIKGQNANVVTNDQGNYSINIPDRLNIVLVFTSVGYLSKEQGVAGRSVVNIELSSTAAALDVVVIGYQTVRRKDVLSAVSSVGARELKDVPFNSAAEALNGRLAGVTATTAEGSPDAQIRIRVRGGMSITGDNSPLYIIDGVQVENGLANISVQDIQSIDVLKEASATAIYGARGGNGVVIITTKSGRPGRTVVTLNSFVGVRTLAKKLDVLDPYDFVVYQSERSRGSSTDSTNFTKNFGTTWDTLNNYKNVESVDWQEEAFGRTGVQHTHNVGVNGGNNLVTYNFTYTYNGDKAVVLNSNYQRHLLNLKADYKITKFLKLGVTGRYTRQDVFGAGTSSEQGSSYARLRNAVKYRPFLSANQDIDDADLLADPNVGNGLNLYNPIALSNAEYRRKSTRLYNVTGNLTFTLIKNLTFRSIVGYDHNNFIDRQYFDSITPYAVIQGGRKPIAGLDTVLRTTLTNSNVLTYSRQKLNNRHDITVLVGEETYDLRTTSQSSLFRNYPLNTSHGEAFSNPALGGTFTGYPRLGKARYTNLSFFTSISYGYKDKYLASFNMRADAGSKFAPGRQWGYFPAGSIGWRVKAEKFMENVKFINDLKFRAGVGTIGNNRIGDYLYLPTFASDGRYYYSINGQTVISYYPSSLPNTSLQWEATLSRNLGVDVNLFNRFSLSVDVYRNSSKDLLLNVPIAATYGYALQYQNVGKTSNRGIEVQLNATIVNKPNFRWSANFNISHNKNRIDQLGQNQKFFFPPTSWGPSGTPNDYIARIGSPVGAMWGLITDGFYKVDDFNYNTATGIYTLKPGMVSDTSIIGTVQPGSIRFKDLNNDGKIDLDNDRTVIGNPTPKFTGGLNQSFGFKRWDATLFVNFSYGNDIYNANKIELTNGYTANSNLLEIMSNRWKVVTADGRTAQFVNSSGQVVGIAPAELTALNQNATIWQPIRGSGAFYAHSWAIEDGSFLRINNLSVGYTFPRSSVSGVGLSRLRLYFTANNLAVITNYTGYDPEVNVRSNNPLTPGLDFSAFPKSRTFIFGLQAAF